MINKKSNLLIRSLLLILACVGSLFAVTWPSGTKYVIEIPIDSTKIGEAISNFPFQKALVTDAKAKANFNSINNICIFDAVRGMIMPKGASYTTKDTVLIGWDGTTVSPIQHRYFACFGLGVNNINSANAYTNSNTTNRYPLDDSTGSTIAIDRAGGANITASGNTTFGVAGKFGKCVSMSTTAKLVCQSDVIGTATHSVEFIFKTNSLSNYNRLFNNGKFLVQTMVSGYLNAYINSTGAGVFPSLAINTWYHVVLIIENTGYLTAYVNGAQTYPRTFLAVPATGTTPLCMGSDYSADTYTLNGYMDEIAITSDAKSAGFALTRYNMLMNPQTFWTQGTSFSVGRGGNKRLAFRQAFKDAWR